MPGTSVVCNGSYHCHHCIIYYSPRFRVARRLVLGYTGLQSYGAWSVFPILTRYCCLTACTRLHRHLRSPQRLPGSACNSSSLVHVVPCFLSWRRVCHVTFSIDCLSRVSGRRRFWSLRAGHPHHGGDKSTKSPSIHRRFDWRCRCFLRCPRTRYWRLAHPLCKLEMDILDHVRNC